MTLKLDSDYFHILSPPSPWPLFFSPIFKTKIYSLIGDNSSSTASQSIRQFNVSNAYFYYLFLNSYVADDISEQHTTNLQICKCYQ